MEDRMSVQKWDMLMRMQAIVPLQHHGHANNWIGVSSLAGPGSWGRAIIPADLGKLGQRREGSPLVLHHIVPAKVR